MASDEVISEATELAKAEVKTRTRILGYLASLLKNPQTPPKLKLFIVLVLLVAIAISSIITIAILHIGAAVINGGEIPDPKFYVIFIVGLVIALIGLSIPLILQSNSTEEMMRLDENLGRVQSARYNMQIA